VTRELGQERRIQGAQRQPPTRQTLFSFS
jgi:hypothetical protein